MTTQFETDLPGAIGLVRRTILDCRFVPTLGIETDFGIVARIRGAWGQRIKAFVETGVGEAEVVRNVFFGDSGHAIRPWLISARPDGIHLNVRLTLFGSASRWQNLAFDSFVAALTDGRGLAWKSDKRSPSSPMRLLGAQWHRSEWLDTGEHRSVSRLRTTAPLRLIVGGVLDVACGSFMPAIARRVCDLAAWSSCNVRDGIEPAMKSAHSASIDAARLSPAMWIRNSTRHKRRHLHVGLQGDLLISELDHLGHALIIAGEVIGVGNEVGLGMGQYEILN